MKTTFLFVSILLFSITTGLFGQWSCELDVPDPVIQVTRAVHEDAATPFIRYYVEVTNRQLFPAEMFEAAPQLPPCGLNTEASRSWITIFDKNGNHLAGYCAVYDPLNMTDLWYSVDDGSPAPDSIYLEVYDRFCEKHYLSTLIPVDVKPDLIISEIHVNSYSPTQIDYDVIVKNVGTAPVNMSGPDPDSDLDNIAFQGLLSGDTIYNNLGDLPAGGRVVAFGDPGYLNPGETMTSNMIAGVQLDTFNTPYIVAKIDVGNEVDELDEFNNTKGSLFIDIPTLVLTPVDSMPTYGPVGWGLTWDGRYLWQSERSSHLLVKIDPTTKSIISHFTTDLSDPAGLAWDGTNLWCADWGGSINKIDTVAKNITQTFYYATFEVFGITRVDTFLYAAGDKGELMKISESTGSILSRRQYASNFRDITFDGTNFWMVMMEPYVNAPTYIWCANIHGDLIQRYILKSDTLTPSGITFDGTHLVISDLRNDRIYFVELNPLTLDSENHNQSVKTGAFSMVKTWPNPFNPKTNISFELHKKTTLTVHIYDIQGRQIKSLFHGIRPAGNQIFTWDGTDDNSLLVSSGVYFVRVQANNMSLVKKVVLLK